jgi:hypothetical protein
VIAGELAGIAQMGWSRLAIPGGRPRSCRPAASD